MRIELRSQVRLEDRKDVLDQGPSSRHPLVIGSAAVVVGAVQAAAREAVHQPLEQSFVTGVHAQDDLRLASIAAEGALADEEADKKATLEIGQIGHAFVLSRVCFTVKKNVKRRRGRRIASGEGPRASIVHRWPI